MILLNKAAGAAQPLRRPFFASGLRRVHGFGGVRALVVLTAALNTSCVDALSGVGDGPTQKPVKIAQLSEAIAARYTTPERSGQFESARRRLVSGALVPSRAFFDTAIWSASSPTSRLLGAHGGLTERGYRFEMSSDPPALARPGDTRHTIALRRLTDNEFRWDTYVDFAIGSITAADVSALMSELLAGGQDRDAAAVRSAALARFPRSAAVVSRIFSIDSLTLHAAGQGTTTVNMLIGVSTDGLRATAPHFAEYVTKYVANSQYRFTITDRSGATYFEVIGGNHKLSVRYRVKGGSIVSYYGPPRALPDSLRLS